MSLIPNGMVKVIMDMISFYAMVKVSLDMAIVCMTMIKVYLEFVKVYLYVIKALQQMVQYFWI
jgi:hypothetical protein